MKSHGISTQTLAEMLILFGDKLERIRSEAALAKLWDVCPAPASSGKTNHMRLNLGGNRHAIAALYLVAIVCMRDDKKQKLMSSEEAQKAKHGARYCPASSGTSYARLIVIFAFR